MSLSMTFSPSLESQSPNSTTENEVWPEVDVHIQLPTNLRILSFAGLEQAVGYPFQQWYIAAGLGYQIKPMLRPHWTNIDPDKEHYLLVGAGFEFLRTAQSGQMFDEKRLTFDITPSVRPWSRILLRDRNWIEVRWVNGSQAITYRNLISVEGDARVRNFYFTPFGTVELFYDGSNRSWDQEWYTGGVQLPHKPGFMLEAYYRREQCATCTPQSWNIVGATLHFFLQRPE